MENSASDQYYGNASVPRPEVGFLLTEKQACLCEN